MPSKHTKHVQLKVRELKPWPPNEPVVFAIWDEAFGRYTQAEWSYEQGKAIPMKMFEEVEMPCDCEEIAF